MTRKQLPTEPVKLTENLIKGLDPGAARYEVRDTELRGLKIRVTPAGVKTFCLVYRNREGRQIRYTVGHYGQITLKQARDLAAEAMGEVAGKNDPQEKKRKARKAAAMPTLMQFVDGDYGDWVKAHHKSSIKTMHRLESVLEAFGSTKLDRITAWNLEKWRAQRLKAGRKPATVNRDIDTLKAALSKAVEWKVIDQHPVAGVKRVKAEEAGRIRYLTQAEEKRLREALCARDSRMRARRSSANTWREQRGYESKVGLSGAADHLTPMVLLAMNTGLRRGELFLLTWGNVNLPRAMLTVQAKTAKSSRTRHVPLNTEALAVLRTWKASQADTGSLVFPGRDGKPFDNINRSWNAVREAAKLKDFTFHDLRHHFASRLVMASVDLNTVRELLGHSDIKMTLRYAHLAPEHKADAVARLVQS